MTATSDVTGVSATRVADRHQTTSRAARDWERYAWAAGIIYVIALVAESVIAVGVGLTQNDSAGKMANALYEHRARLVVIAGLSALSRNLGVKRREPRGDDAVSVVEPQGLHLRIAEDADQDDFHPGLA
jgi:hypothetical protein